jgi:hypothetical protein
MPTSTPNTTDPELAQEALHKELDLCQSVVSRMAKNSFQLKTWAFGLTGGVLAIAKDGLFDNPWSSFYIPILVLVILFSFWYLDAYFLRQEQLFLKVYERIVADPTCKNRIRYDLRPDEQMNIKSDSEKKIMWSITLRWFYGIPFLLTVLLFFWLEIRLISMSFN